jgi:hypothetical protein
MNRKVAMEKVVEEVMMAVVRRRTVREDTRRYAGS